MTMPSFQHITPPLRVFHGADSLAQLGRELDRIGSRRAVVVCGPWARGPLLDQIRAAIGERCAGVFADVAAHSPLQSVEAAAAHMASVDADAAIALGGGSAIVTARAASILVAEKRSVRELCTTTGPDGVLKSPKLVAPKMPQLVVPTTPTTAMVKAGSAVFVPETDERLAMFDPKTRAHAVFIHPDFVLSAPGSLVASASLNTMAMAIEGLVSRSGNPIADGLLMHALRLTGAHLGHPHTHGDPAVRGELLLAAILCGQGTDHAAAGITTVLGHAIGARFGTENGIANAIVLPEVLRFNADASISGLAKVAAALDLPRNPAKSQIQTINHGLEAIFGALAIPRRLRDVAVPREALPDIARHAMGDWFLKGNPRPVREAAELEHILEKTW
jgi:alcohol dehydrogenase class IV